MKNSSKCHSIRKIENGCSKTMLDGGVVCKPVMQPLIVQSEFCAMLLHFHSDGTGLSSFKAHP